MKTSLCLMLAAVIAGLTSVGCASVSWEMTKVEHTRAAYEDFITKHPKSVFIGEARKQAECTAYQEACDRNTVEAYQEFLKNYPDGRYARGAGSRLRELLQRQCDKSALPSNGRRCWQPMLVIQPIDP